MKTEDREHIEKLRDEVFLTNCTAKQFREIQYRTKRLGTIAYTTNGTVIDNMFPCFVSKEEYEENLRKWLRK